MGLNEIVSTGNCPGTPVPDRDPMMVLAVAAVQLLPCRSNTHARCNLEPHNRASNVT